MVYRVFKNADLIGKAVSSLYAAQVLDNPNSVLGFATGSTPLPSYKSIIELYNAGVIDFNGVTTFNLDEYCGLDHKHDQSYYYFMTENLFKYINVPVERIHVPNGMAKDFAEEGKSYDAAIDAAGGIDLQILGLGNNGHIAFNEPCGEFPIGTHQVKLTDSTIEANKRFFASADEVPKYAITMGIGTIMKARGIVLVATGKSKAEAVRAMIQKAPTPDCPASALQFHHNVTVFLDEEAASLL